MVSKVKFTDLVSLEMPAATSLLPSVLEDVSATNSMNNPSAQTTAELIDHFYPDFAQCVANQTLDQVFDAVSIDTKSLQNYMRWLRNGATKFSAGKRKLYLLQAHVILTVAKDKDGMYYQRKLPSDFGRTYYSGTSVQNVNKELRRAMLGNCWEYDIRSSVVSWKMGYAKIYIDSLPGLHDLRREFSATLSFLEDKEDFMATIRHSVFLKESRVPKNLQTDLLKQSFTAISFGAKHNKIGWPNDQGGWTNSAISDIIKNSEERERFVLDATVVKFTEEQNALDTFIVFLVKLQRRDLLKREILQTNNGQPSKSKILAYLYQHDETEIMDVVRETAAKNDRP
jgi:hypothetical protein